MPLVEQGKSVEEISKQADVYFDTSKRNQVNDTDFQNTRLYSFVQFMKGYPGAADDLVTKFNDIEDTTAVLGFNVPDLKDTDDMVATLKNVGDNTPVFASKAGAHMIISLEAKKDGPYGSYDKMLTYYKEKFVFTKTQKLYRSFSKKYLKWNEYIKQTFKNVFSMINGKVYAEPPPPPKPPPPSGRCAGHDVLFWFISRDLYTWAEIPGGAQVVKSRGSGSCGYEGTY